VSSEGLTDIELLGLVEAFRHVPAAVTVVDADGAVVFANARARELTDRVGEPMQDWQVVRSIGSGEEVVDEDCVHPLADGGELVLRCSSAPVRDADGRTVASLLVMVDVTAERQTAERLSYFDRLLDSTEDGIVGTDAEFRINVWNPGAERIYGYSADEVLGRPARDVASYEGDGSRRRLEASLLETDRTRTELRARRKDGSSVEVEMVAVAVRDDRGHVVGYLGVHRDTTNRKRTEQELENRVRQQAVVASLGVEALGETEALAVMDAAAAAVARTLAVDQVAVAEILPGGDELVLRAGTGFEDGAVGHARGPAGRGSLVGYTVMTGEPVITEDASSDERFDLSPFLAAYGPVSAVSVVIAGRDQPIGALGAFTRYRRAFSADDVNFLQAVANVVSVAYATARTETRRPGAPPPPPRRIARDLHDEALQNLTAAAAEATRRSPAPDDPLVAALKGVGRQLRAAIYDLRLVDEENRPLAERLRQLAAMHAPLGPARIEAQIAESTPAVTGQRGTEVLRIVAEALTNARRHSGAGTIRVESFSADGALCVGIADDGAGFDKNGPRAPQAAGLIGVRERADLLGADVDIESETGRGTVVHLQLPLEDAPPEPVRILLVEDHVAVREAIAAQFEREPDFTVVAQAGSLAEAREMLDGVDVALLDLGLPDGFGADLIEELWAVSPRAEALVLSASLDRASMARAVHGGAAGLIDKVAHLDEVVDAVRRLRAGERLLPVDDLVELLSYDRRRREQEHLDREAIAALTQREVEVLQALADGLGSQAIADKLHITVRTERNHVANILAKLDLHSRLQALVFCLRYGVVEIR
jgi:PAS domain S-box-containing protein